jgi:hypothetical protein
MTSSLRFENWQRPNGNPVGVPVQVQHYSNSTRTALSNATSFTLWSGINFNKLRSDSFLWITGQLVFSNAFSYNMGYWWQIGASGLRRDSIFQCHYPSDASRAVSIKVGWFINGIYSTTAVGSQAISVGWASINGGADMPGSVWNPNAVDDARSQQHSSNLTIMEIITSS